MQSHTTLLKPFDPVDTMPQKTSVKLPTFDGGELILHDTIRLGHRTSKRMSHYHHEGVEYAPRKHRCSACRWFEVALFRTETDYVLWSCGHTVVPGENSRILIERTSNEWRIVELMTVRKGETAFIPSPSAGVLADAAKLDEGIRDAYVNRATP